MRRSAASALSTAAERDLALPSAQAPAEPERQRQHRQGGRAGDERGGRTTGGACRAPCRRRPTACAPWPGRARAGPTAWPSGPWSALGACAHGSSQVSFRAVWASTRREQARDAPCPPSSRPPTAPSSSMRSNTRALRPPLLRLRAIWRPVNRLGPPAPAEANDSPARRRLLDGGRARRWGPPHCAQGGKVEGQRCERGRGPARGGGRVRDARGARPGRPAPSGCPSRAGPAGPGRSTRSLCSSAKGGRSRGSASSKGVRPDGDERGRGGRTLAKVALGAQARDLVLQVPHVRVKRRRVVHVLRTVVEGEEKRVRTRGEGEKRGRPVTDAVVRKLREGGPVGGQSVAERWAARAGKSRTPHLVAEDPEQPVD